MKVIVRELSAGPAGVFQPSNTPQEVPTPVARALIKSKAAERVGGERATVRKPAKAESRGKDATPTPDTKADD